VANNPLNATDPSGFMFNGMFKVPFIDSPWNTYIKPNAPQIIALAIGFATQQWYLTSGYWGGAIGAGVAGGFAGGFVGSGGNVQAGLQGAITGALFAAAGGIGKDISWSRLGAHALAGCVSGELQGGKCGTGAISAVAGKAVTMGLDMHYGGNIPFAVGFTSAVVSGGTASVIAGEKFANGAVTGAFGYLYNELSKVTLPKFGETYLDDSFYPKVQQFISHLNDNGVNIIITSAYRTPEQQAELKNLSKAGVPGIITPADNSLHSAGFAIDISWKSLGKSDRKIVLDTANQIGLRWGGNFRKPDPVHFDYKPKENIKELIENASKKYNLMKN
jgi:hypothetical protein